MSAVVHRTKHTREFVVVPNAIAQAPALSYRARGLLVAILSRPPGASLSLEVLAAEAPKGEGRDAVAAAMRELKDAGYVRQVRRRNEQGRIVTDTLVTDVPQDAGAGFLAGASPDTGFQGLVHRGSVDPCLADREPVGQERESGPPVEQVLENRDLDNQSVENRAAVEQAPDSRALVNQLPVDQPPVDRDSVAPAVKKRTTPRNSKPPTPPPDRPAVAPRSHAKRGRGDQLTPEATPTPAPAVTEPETQPAPVLTAPPAPDPDVITRFLAGLPERMRPIKPGDTAKVAYALAGFLAAGWDPDTLATLVGEAAPPTRIVSRSGLITSRLEALAQSEATPGPGQRFLPFEQAPWCGQCDSADYRWIIDEVTDTARYCPTCSPQATARSHAG